MVLILLFAGSQVGAQGGISVKSSVDRDSILIGEQLHLNLEASFPLQEPMRFFTIDSIPHFEILERNKIDTVDKNKMIRISQSLTLTSFDSGRWTIPAFELPGDKPLTTDSIVVDVRFSPFDPNQDYHGIKDIINVEVRKPRKPDWYWYAAASAVLVAAIVYLLTRKKKKPAPAAPAVAPYDEATKELEKLRKEKPPAKLFYTRLVDIFRLYISRRKGIASLQKTADDLVEQLRSLKLPEDEYRNLAQALRMSDFVKFAKYEPAETDKEDSFRVIRQSIDLIEKSDKAQPIKSNQ